MDQPSAEPSTPTSNPPAVLALVFGVLALLLAQAGAAGGLVAIAAICLGVTGERRARKLGAPGEKMALGGILAAALAIAVAVS